MVQQVELAQIAVDEFAFVVDFPHGQTEVPVEFPGLKVKFKFIINKVVIVER